MKSILGILLVIVAALGCGCSGISASKSVSPLDFFLPGLIQNSPPPPAIPRDAHGAPLLAGASYPLPPSALNERPIP